MRRRRDDDGDNGWKELGGYMHSKIQKLQNQYQAEEPKLAENEKLTAIFKGVTIYVNGLTDPTADELRRLMTVHGGVFHHYYVAQATTHIIATNLAYSKIKNVSKRDTIVTPKWIVDSIAAGKLLPHHPYLLYSQNYKNQDTIKFNADSKTETAGQKQIAIDAKDSRFLSEFYNHSRLHLISTLAAELKRHVGILREQSDGSFKGYERIDQWRSRNDIPAVDNFENQSVVMHIDMDCFFVSVGLRTRSELIGKPVAVTHSRGVGPSTNNNSELRKYEKEYYRQNRMINSKRGLSKEIDHENENNNDASGNGSTIDTEKENDKFVSCSEVASCSYEARKCGIRNGMFLGEAKSLCSNLYLIPYDFDGYREVAYTLYNTVASYTLNIEAVSCDELYIDCTELLKNLQIAPLTFAEILRNEIKEQTGCPSSTGLASNMLLARLATRKAKPNGQFYLESGDTETFLAELSVGDIPGVGWSLSNRLNAIGIKLCCELQKISLLTLQSEFGVKTGQMLHEMCRGIDGRRINTDQIRKSVSAEINYGIRFTKVEEAHKFLNELSEEVGKRLFEVGKAGKTITLKLKVRKKGAPIESSKFLGHGICDSISRSVSLKSAINDPKLIARQVQSLLLSFKIRVSDLRGIGIQVQRLEAVGTNSRNLLKYLQQPEIKKVSPVQSSETETTKRISLPPPSEVDLDFFAELPDELRAQICNEYEEQGLKLESFSALKPILNLTNQTETAPTLSEIDDTCQNQCEEVRLCNVTHVDDVKQLITEWVATCSNPGFEDTETISIYLKELVTDKNLERVYIVIKFLRRLTLKNSNNAWMTAFQTILAKK
uniref:DNA repair protein REV1 n=1 Tax=Strigamia maritima TaxID=126957 RepID=T1J4C2_STRMM